MRTALALTLALAAAVPVQAQPPPPGATLESLLEHARTHNPELAAMRLEAEAAAHRVQPAGALPDPVLRVELENFNNYGSDAGPNLLPARVGETKYTLMQPLPGWGKRDLRQAVAQADAGQARARAAAAWNELAARIKSVHARHYLVAGSEQVTLEVLDLMSRLEQIARARYAGGLVPQQDAIRAQLEQGAMRAELIAFDSEKRQLQARLNALLARDTLAPLATPQRLRALPDPSALDASSLARRLRTDNPTLQAEEARLLAATRNRDLVQRNRYPDFQVGLSPTQMRSRVTTWSLMLEMNLPLQQASRRAQESEAQTMVGAARARTEALGRQLSGELAEQLAGLAAARRTEALLAGQLQPQSELGLRSALAGYENGKVDFSALLDAQRQIRKVRQERLKAEVEAHQRLAEIERILGVDL